VTVQRLQQQHAPWLLLRRGRHAWGDVQERLCVCWGSSRGSRGWEEVGAVDIKAGRVVQCRYSSGQCTGARSQREGAFC
jgi:hypothetical protein